MLRGTNNQSRAGGFDHIVGNKGEFVDLEDALDLDEQPVQQAEITAGYTGNGCRGLMVGEVRVIQLQAELSPVAAEHKGQFGERISTRCQYRLGLWRRTERLP
jgi:hypothetical protein